MDIKDRCEGLKSSVCGSIDKFEAVLLASDAIMEELNSNKPVSKKTAKAMNAWIDR